MLFHAALVATFMSVVAPEEVETVPLPVMLDGQSHIVLTLEKSEQRDGGPWNKSSFVYDVTLAAPDKSDQRAMRWSLKQVDGKAVTPGNSISPDIEMTVDATLTPLTVDNLSEIIAVTREQLNTGEHSPEGTEAAIRLMAGLTPEQAASLFARDPQLIALGQGTDLYPGEDHSTELEAPLPWGGVSVTMRQTYRLERYDPDAGVAEILWSQEIDPVSLVKVLPELLAGMIGEAGIKGAEGEDVEAKMQAAIANARFENSRNCSYLIDIASGLAAKVECRERIDFSVEGKGMLRERRMVASQRLIN